MHQLTDLAGGSAPANAAVRIHGTRNLVDAAKAAGVCRIVVQSIAWAYEPGDEPAGEDVALDVGAPPPRATTIEGIAALEGAARELPEWVVLRYGLLYGPGTWYAPDGARADAARAGAIPAGDDVTSFLHVDDAAAAAVDALRWPPGAVNVCDDEPATGREWVPVFCRAVGADPPPAGDAPRAGWARGASNRHMREDLAWTPRHPSWRDGFATGRASTPAFWRGQAGAARSFRPAGPSAPVPRGSAPPLRRPSWARRVAIVERTAVLGGVSANTGTLPSKTARAADPRPDRASRSAASTATPTASRTTITIEGRHLARHDQAIAQRATPW